MLDWDKNQGPVVRGQDCCLVSVNQLAVPKPVNTINNTSHFTMQCERLMKDGWYTGIIHHNCYDWSYRTKRRLVTGGIKVA